MYRKIQSWVEDFHPSHDYFLNSMKPMEPWECNDSHTASSNIAYGNRLIDPDEIAVFQGPRSI